MTRWSSGSSMFRTALFLVISLLVLPILASGNQLSSNGIDVEDMTQGVIAYSYDITDGTESAAPRLQATLQFNESADIDEVIFILRSSAPEVDRFEASRLHRLANFTANNIGSNTWTLDEPLSAQANGSYEYYLNFAYKSGQYGSDFNGAGSMPGGGVRWSNLVTAFAAQDMGFLSQADPILTFGNPIADTENPSFSHYISSIEGSDPSEIFYSAQDAAHITGNDGDASTPIKVKLTAVFSEPVTYATDYTYVYPEEGSSYSSYNDASIQIDGSTVTYTWTFDSKTPIYRLRPYLFAYDSGLNRTYERDTVEFTNILADASQPTLQSVTIAGRIGDNQEKYIDYDFQFDAADIGTSNMKEIGISFKGPNCDSVYTRFHDYNLDPELKPGQYKGSWRLLDNHPFGYYRVSSSLYVHDQQLNRRFHTTDELNNDFSLTRFSLQGTGDGQQTAVSSIYCPTFTEKLRQILFATNSTNIVASYENTIQDGEGNIVTPRFSLKGDDAAFFNISASGVITFKSPPNNENPLDADADNNYELMTHIYAADSSNPDYVSDDNHSVYDIFSVGVDYDSDSDGVAESIDEFPSDASESVDTDYDGIGNNADPDDDNDGASDAFDAFPLDSSEFLDTDADGIGNNADTDDDNDGVLDTQDIFPLDDYKTALLDSDLSVSPFGIVAFSASAVEDPSIILGFTSRNFSLSALGYYLESGRSTDVGIWSGVGQGYELAETINTEKSYPSFNDQNDLASTFKAEGYTNINFLALASTQPSSVQYEVIYKTTFRLAVIEKGSELWSLAFQMVTNEYATNATYPVAIDTSKPIRSSVSSVGTYTILSPDREISPFTSSELVGTWMIGGINEDDMTLAARCKEENNDGLVCADLVTLNSDGTGSTQMSGRSLSWSVINDGSLRLTFSDNNTVFSVRQIEKNTETISTLVSGVANSKYFARTQLMVKQQDGVPQLDDLLLGETLASGFYVTNPDYLRSSVDNRLIEFFGFMLNTDGTGTRIYEYASSTEIDVNGVSVVTGVTNYSREITWSYDPDDARKLVSKLCYDGNPLPDNFNWDDCVNLQTRTWNIVRATSTRLYVLETIQYDFDSTGDGVIDSNGYFITRPNFYEVSTYDANDVDGDGYANDVDVFPVDATDWLDFDGDGVGDNADTDDDNDGVADESDAFPFDATETLDTDSDGIGNSADTDDDNDGVSDGDDTFPLDATESVDTDSDGVGDNADTDDDNDGVADGSDAFPFDATETLDTDGDGIGNNVDPDDDNDGASDAFDAFPLDSSEFLDTDSDGVGDNADNDDDNDGVLDTQDIFPLDDYKTALLDSDLATSPFGIVGFSASAVEDPSIILGFTSRNFSLSPLGYYLESGQLTDVGIWSGVGQGYELVETTDSEKAYPFLSQQDLASIFKAPGYTNINYSALATSQPSSSQYEVIYKTTHRFAAIEKGAETWELAYQIVTDEYATNQNYPIAIDTSKPIRSNVLAVGTYTMLSPEREIPAFNSSELIGTWMIGGINEDDMTLAARCKEENNYGLVCADLVTLNSDGTGSTQMSGRSLSWLVNNGSLRLTFSDNNTVFSVRQIEKNAETISTLVSGVANNKYFARTQLMVKQQDTAPQLDDLLLGETLASGFYVTYPGYLRSSVDNRLIEFFGFMLNADGTGTRIYGGVSSTVIDVNGVSVVTGVTNYNREIIWSYDSDDARKLVSKLCYLYNPLPDNFDWDNCDLLQTRTWNIVRATSTRLYVLETIQVDQDTTGDGVLDTNSYVITRPNFYEVRTYDINDVDGDGYTNDVDSFPLDAADWADFDSDGVGDNGDTDDDNDGVADGSDAFPFDATETLDTDSDGIGNSADTDDDNDGVSDSWSVAQLGSDIDGQSEYDLASRLALSGDGTVLAVGSWGANSYTGLVRIFKWNDSNGNWIQQGNTILGENPNDYTGYSISLSDDGSVVAIDSSGGAAPNENGYVRVYDWDGQDWFQRGNNISGESAGDACCYLSLSADGATIAVAAQRSAGSSNLVDSGQTRVFSWNGTDWNQRGLGIDGEAANDRSGRWATSLSADGESLAIGARMNDGNGTDSGHVRVYKWVSSAWVQRGEDLDGEAAGDLSGNSVSLSSNGEIVAIGAPGNDGPNQNSGHVRVFGWSDETSSWIRRGQDIDGEQATCDPEASYIDSDSDGITDTCGDESGWASHLSSDGSTLAVGAWKNDDNGKDSGQTRVYGWDEPSQIWVQQGPDINGEAAGDHSGYQTALNSNGSVIAIGAWANAPSGNVEAGHVRVFKLGNPTDAFPLDGTETTDTDSDGIGNNADVDDDNDGVADGSDAFPLISLAGLTDTDGDGRPNDCDSSCLATGMTADTDDDNDGMADESDAFPLDATETTDTDSDGIGNNADMDDDNDGVADDSDAFPLISLAGLTDTDGDGRPNECDSSCVEMGMAADDDDDNDGIADGDDVFPLDAAESVDTDSDGIGNNADTDDDNDGIPDSSDALPLDATESIDTDSDGVGNNADPDDDNDGIADGDDVFPLDESESVDTDSDGVGNNADTDDDGDGVADINDSSPLDPTNDSDGDGVGNNNDPFPENSLYTKDTDLDGMPDAWEILYGLDPNDPTDAQSDRDNDGVVALDEFIGGTIPSGSLDIDGNESFDALSDGLLMLRGMFGLDEDALITGIVASDATYTTSTDIEARISMLGDLADIDGNGQIDALSDGMLILRYLFGLEGDILVKGVVAPDATRSTPEEIQAHLDSLTQTL